MNVAAARMSKASWSRFIKLSLEYLSATAAVIGTLGIYE